MGALFNSFLIVAAAEMGDRTQLLALLLTARFKQPWVVLAGVFVATVLNHAIAAELGTWISLHIGPKIMAYVLATSFFVFALWILVPDKVDAEKMPPKKWGAFLTTIGIFFMAEMGDKTQVATIALGANYASTWQVILGTTLGMMFSNALAIFLGEKLLSKFPMAKIRIFSAILFALFGVGIIIQRIMSDYS